MFLRGQEPYEKAINMTKGPTYSEIAAVYSRLFQEYRRDAPVDAEEKLENFAGYFGRLLTKLAEMKSQSKGTVEAFSNFSRHYWTMCDNLQDYEINGVSVYFGKNYQQLFKSEHRSAFFNPFDAMQSLLKLEQREVAAMIEILNVMKVYKGALKHLQGRLSNSEKDHIKLTAGKITLGSLFSSKPKDEIATSLKENLRVIQGEIQAIELILNIMTVRFLEYEVPEFLKLRCKKYCRSLRYYGQVSVKEFEEVTKGPRELSQI